MRLAKVLFYMQMMFGLVLWIISTPASNWVRSGVDAKLSACCAFLWGIMVWISATGWEDK